jgi:DNA-directed RNA polymerase subunit RPC12/RpoP
MHLGAGETPGKGKYLCLKCATKVILNDDSEPLPVCPNCEYTEFEELEIELE